MPFRPSFDCLWCGRRWETRAAEDLEGWAQLCADCLGSAGDNEFRRARLRAGLAERAVSGRGDGEAPAASVADGVERDDWYLRRGRFSNGPIDDMAWQMELDTATLWLDGLPLSGEIVELDAGTGWWSPLLAGKGELWLYDAREEPLERARARLVAHGLRAHLHMRGAWVEPDRTVDAVFCGVWLSQVPSARLAEFLALARRWLMPGGRFAFIDSRRDLLVAPEELEAALIAAGFVEAAVTTTARFFLLGVATAGE
jgi:SAM-dependent methyltransferase